jgi:hypothetical protein
MRIIALLFMLILMNACSPKQDTTAVQAPPEPTWVQSRPMSGMYYTGIGVSQKNQNTNFQRTARESALSDLASEIKVNVNTNSLLYTLEREYKFEQEFKETIKVSSNLDLEDFEMVDSWEDANSYWVYYRLSKQDYADKQQQKKDAAQSLALDFYAKALSAQTGHQFRIAADSYLRGLQALEAFWGENNTVDFQGSSIQLDNALYSGIRDLLNNIRLTLENELVLTYQNGFKSLAQVRVSDSRSNMAYEGVPLGYEYFGLYGIYRGQSTTNADGRVEIAINEAERERENNVFVVQVDTEFIFEPFLADRFMRKLTESMRSTSLREPIKYRAPRMYVDAVEKNLGQVMGTAPLSAAIKTSLGRRGVRFAESPADADLSMTLRSDTQKAGSEQGFFTNFLEMDLTVRNNITGEKVYNVSRADLRGVDLDHERAGMKAYQNLTRNIESELMRKMVTDLF